MSSRQILKSVSVENFKIFRGREVFDFAASTYFVGPNNTGKSTVLTALKYFFDFDNLLYEDRDFLNKTAIDSRKRGARESKIGVTFNLLAVRSATLKARFTKIDKLSKAITITKIAKLSESGVLTVDYDVNGQVLEFAQLPEHVKSLITSVKINYLHPQQGAALLKEAQVKLKRRLLDNWGRGRGSTMTQSMRDLETEWEKFRQIAKEYLSESLKVSVSKIWPDSDVNITLPNDIKSVLQISDISFSSTKGGPMVDLLSQGSGAQSLILYFAHYILDSDKTPYRAAEYHPVWLIEEPESFLHADLVSQLANEFNSQEWLDNIQLMISTHSAILLAKSRNVGNESHWHRMGSPRLSKASTMWSSDELRDMGRMLGDANFLGYFLSSSSDRPVILEDSRQETADAFKRSGLNVLTGLKGISDINRTISSLLPLEETLTTKTYFIVDNDRGLTQIKSVLSGGDEVAIQDGFKLVRIGKTDALNVIVLPTNQASEDLFKEFAIFLDECVKAVYDPSQSVIKQGYPNYLAGVVAGLYKTKPELLDRAMIEEMIKTNTDVKSVFWKDTKENRYNIRPEVVDTINNLIGK